MNISPFYDLKGLKCKRFSNQIQFRKENTINFNIIHVNCHVFESKSTITISFVHDNIFDHENSRKSVKYQGAVTYYNACDG